MRLSLTTKFIVLTACLILWASLAVMLFLIKQEEKASYQRLLKDGGFVSTMLAMNSDYSIYTEDMVLLRQLGESVFKDDAVEYVAIVGRDDRQLISLGFPPESHPAHTEQWRPLPVFPAVSYLEGGRGIVGSEVVDFLVQVVSLPASGTLGMFPESSPEVLGHIHLGFSTAAHDARIRDFIISALGVTSVVLLAGLILTFVLVRRVIRPVKQCASIARRISQGDFDQSMEVLSSDEVAELSRAFNHMLTELRSYRRQQERQQQLLEVTVEERTKELQATQAQLLEAAHRAGMAEVATGVLHNIGNINSTVNTTVDGLINSLRKLPTSSLIEMVAMLEDQGEGLAAFLQEDERGRKFLPYMRLALGKQKNQEEELLSKALYLYENIVHVNEIIQMQQTYARSGVGVSAWEKCSLQDLVEDTLRFLQSGAEKRQVEVCCEFLSAQPVLASRSQLMQILVNLIKNALESFDSQEAAATGRRVEIRERLAEGGGKAPAMVELVIRDNGCGFAPELANTIFNFGFSTREKGAKSGYGLHYCANYLQSIGGNLSAHSDGPGQGAVFTIHYPLEPKNCSQGEMLA